MIGLASVTGQGVVVKGRKWHHSSYLPLLTVQPSVYPWKELPMGTVICDLGGSNGHAMLQVAKAASQVKVIVQDLESTGILDQGKEVRF